MMQTHLPRHEPQSPDDGSKPSFIRQAHYSTLPTRVK